MRRANGKKARKLTRGAVSGVNAGRARFLRPARACVHCGKLHRRKLGAKYCSGACKSAAYRQAHRKDLPVERGVALRVCTCANPRCGVEFWASSPAQVFCCDSCRVIAHGLKKRVTVAAASAVFGLPEGKVWDVLDVRGIAPVLGALAVCGYVFDRQALMFVQVS
jgi:hypothetical protein